MLGVWVASMSYYSRKWTPSRSTTFVPPRGLTEDEVHAQLSTRGSTGANPRAWRAGWPLSTLLAHPKASLTSCTLVNGGLQCGGNRRR